MQVKIRLFFIGVLILSFFGCEQNASYTIDGNVNIDSGTVYLQSFRNKMFFVIDSAEVKDGKFTFKGSVEHPDLYGITLDRNESFSPWFIFLENAPIHISINTEDKRNYTVSGSATHDLFTAYRTNPEDFDLGTFIQANPASIVSAYILYRDYSYRLSEEELTSYLQMLAPSLKNTEYVEVVERHVETLRKVAVGNPAPDFSAPTPDGKTVSLSDYTGKGYLLLDFWASWCGPCRRENPNLVAAYTQYHEYGFDIFAVSLDRNRKSWLEAIEKDQLTWTHVSDLLFWDSEPAQVYSVRAIPANFLIDPSGKIIAHNLTGEALQQKLKEIFELK